MIRDFFKRLFGKSKTVSVETPSSEQMIPQSTAFNVVPVYETTTVETMPPAVKSKVKKPRAIKSQANVGSEVQQTAWPFDEPVSTKSKTQRSKKSDVSSVAAAAITASKKKSATSNKITASKAVATDTPKKSSRTKKNV